MDEHLRYHQRQSRATGMIGFEISKEAQGGEQDVDFWAAGNSTKVRRRAVAEGKSSKAKLPVSLLVQYNSETFSST